MDLTLTLGCSFNPCPNCPGLGHPGGWRLEWDLQADLCQLSATLQQSTEGSSAFSSWPLSILPVALIPGSSGCQLPSHCLQRQQLGHCPGAAVAR